MVMGRGGRGSLSLLLVVLVAVATAGLPGVVVGGEAALA